MPKKIYKPKELLRAKRRFSLAAAVLTMVLVAAGYMVYRATQAAPSGGQVNNIYSCDAHPKIGPNTSNSNCVKHLKWYFNKSGYSIDHSNGNYNKQLTDMVKSLQRRSGLEATGVAGAQVWNLLHQAALPTPAVQLKANNQTGSIIVHRGATLTLSWTTSNQPLSCVASSSWGGSKPTGGGTANLGVQTTLGTKAYVLTCSNHKMAVASTVKVTITPPPPVVSVAANGSDSVNLVQGSGLTIRWSATNSPASCSAAGNWSGGRGIAGGSENRTSDTATVGTKTYSLTCSNTGGSGSATATVKVSAKTTGNDGGGGTAPAPKPTPKPAPFPGSSDSDEEESSAEGLEADETAPEAPVGFKAERGEVDVRLSWEPATDSSGIKGYELSRSSDEKEWEVLTEGTTKTSYNDEDIAFETKYYYRLRAQDQADNYSEYVAIDITTAEFEANVVPDDETTLQSDDEKLSIVIPAGAVKDPALCAITTTENPEGELPDGQVPIGLAYALDCKLASGKNLTSFEKPAQLTYLLDSGELGDYKDQTLYMLDAEFGTWNLAEFSFDKGAGEITAELSAPAEVRVAGVKKNKWLGTVLTIVFLIVVVGGGIFVYLLRRAQKEHYNDYLRRKYYNL